MTSRQHFSGYNTSYRSERSWRRKHWNNHYYKQNHWYHQDRYEYSDKRNCSNQQPLHNRLENHSNDVHSEERHVIERQNNTYNYYKTDDFRYRGSRKPYYRSPSGKFQEQKIYRKNSLSSYKERSRSKFSEEGYYSPVSDRSSPVSSDDCQRTAETPKKKQQLHYEKNTTEKINDISRKRTVEEMSETENLSPKTSFSAKCSAAKRLKTTNFHEVRFEGHEEDEDDFQDYKKKNTSPSSKIELEKKMEMDKNKKENNRSHLDDINTNRYFAVEEGNVKNSSKYNCEDDLKRRNTNDYLKDTNEKDQFCTSDNHSRTVRVHKSMQKDNDGQKKCRLENQGKENQALHFDKKETMQDHVNTIQENDKPKNCSEDGQVNFSVEDMSSNLLTKSKDITEIPAAQNTALCFDIKRSEPAKTSGTENKDIIDTDENKSNATERKVPGGLKEKTVIMNVLKNLETVKQKAPETHPIINTLVEYLTGSGECKRQEPRDTSETSVNKKSDEKERKTDECNTNKIMKSGQDETVMKSTVPMNSKCSLKKCELLSKEVRKRRRSEPVISNISDLPKQNEVPYKSHGNDLKQTPNTLKTCIIERSRHKSAVNTHSEKLERTCMEKNECANERDCKSSNGQTFELGDDLLRQSNGTISKDNSNKVSRSNNVYSENSKSSTDGRCSSKLEKMKKHSWGTLIPLGKEFGKSNAKQKIGDTEKGKAAPHKTVNEITNLFETMNNEYSKTTQNSAKISTEKKRLFNKNRDRVSHFNSFDGSNAGRLDSAIKGSLMTVSHSSQPNSSFVNKALKRHKNTQQPVMKSRVKNTSERIKQNSQSENSDSCGITTESTNTLTLVGKKVKVKTDNQKERKNIHEEKKASLLKTSTVQERRKDCLKKDIRGEVTLKDSFIKGLKVKKAQKIERASKIHSDRQSTVPSNKSRSKEKGLGTKHNQNRIQKEKEQKPVSKIPSKYAENDDSNNAKGVHNKIAIMSEAAKSETTKSISLQTKSNSASECYAITEFERKKSLGDTKSGVSRESEIKSQNESRCDKRSVTEINITTTDKNDFRLSLHNLMQCEAYVCLSDRKKETTKEGITSEERTDQSEIMDDAEESLDNKLVINEDVNRQKEITLTETVINNNERSTTKQKTSLSERINNSDKSSKDQPDLHNEISISQKDEDDEISKGSDFENASPHLKAKINIVENNYAEQDLSKNIFDKISSIESIEHLNTVNLVSSADTIASEESSTAKDTNTSLRSELTNNVNKEQRISKTSIVQVRKEKSVEKGHEVDDVYAEKSEILTGCSSDYDDDDDDITPIELSTNFEIDVSKEKNVTTYPDDVIIMKRNSTSQTMNSKRKPNFFSERIKVSDFDDDDIYIEKPNGGTLSPPYAQTFMKTPPKDDRDSESSDGELSEVAPILTPSKTSKSKESKRCKKAKKEKQIEEAGVPELPYNAENLTKEGIYKRGFIVQHVKSLKERGYENTYALLNPLYLYQKEKSGKCLLCESCNEYFTPLTFAVHHHVDSVLKRIDIDESMKNEFKVCDNAIGFWNETVKKILADLNGLLDKLRRPGPSVPPKSEKVIAVRPSMDNVTIDESESKEVSKKKVGKIKSPGKNKSSETKQNKQNKEKQKHVEDTLGFKDHLSNGLNPTFHDETESCPRVAQRSPSPSVPVILDNIISHNINNMTFSSVVVQSSSNLGSPASSQYLSKRFSGKFETPTVNSVDNSTDSACTADIFSDAVLTSTPKPELLTNSVALPHNVQKSLTSFAISHAIIPGIGEPLPRGTTSSLSTVAINPATIPGIDEPMHRATSNSLDTVATSQATIPSIGELTGVSRETTSNSLSSIAISQATIPGIGEPISRGTPSYELSIQDTGSTIVGEHSHSFISEETIPSTRDYVEPVVGCAEQNTDFKSSSLASKEESIHSKIMELCHLMDIKSPDAGLNMVMLSSKIQIMGLQKMNTKIVQHLKKPMK